MSFNLSALCAFGERVQCVAQLPQEDERTYEDEAAQDVPSPESAGRKTVGGTESADTVADSVPPDKREDAQGDTREEKRHDPIGEGRFSVQIADVRTHLGVLYQGIDTQRERIQEKQRPEVE